MKSANPPSASLPEALPVPASAGAAPRRRRKEARASEFAAAALALFAEKGFSGTRLDDVAARAGASKGTLYLYFDSKEALFQAVIEDGMGAALATAEAHLAEHHGSAADLLRQLVFGWWENIGQTPLAAISKLVIAESRNFPEVARFYRQNVIERGRRLLRSALQRGIASGEFRCVDLEGAIDLIVAPLLMLAVSRFSFSLCAPQTSPESYLEMHLDLLLNGLRRADDVSPVAAPGDDPCR